MLLVPNPRDAESVYPILQFEGGDTNRFVTADASTPTYTQFMELGIEQVHSIEMMKWPENNVFDLILSLASLFCRSLGPSGFAIAFNLLA